MNKKTKEEIIKETLGMVGDSILILNNDGKITPEHFEMPVRYALDRYQEEPTEVSENALE